MRRALAVAVLALCPLSAAAAAAGGGAGGLAFGRSGGNIVPFRVAISAAGTVRVSGPVHVRRARLGAVALGRLRQDVAAAGFASLPSFRNCPGTLPDVAATYVRSGGRTVAVHGPCSPAFARLWDALARAVGLTYG